MINARSETAGTKPAFRDALKSRRCLIPADAFYEWMRTAKGKQPYCFEVHDGQLFAFAGLWDRWKDPSGNWVAQLRQQLSGVKHPRFQHKGVLDFGKLVWLTSAVCSGPPLSVNS